MPMIELTLPKDSLSKEKTAELFESLTQTLLRWEGAPADSRPAQELSWGYVNWVDEVNVGGKPADKPRYRVVTTVPQGALRDDEVRNGLVADVTKAVVDAEGSGDDPAAAARVWVIIKEVIDGNWGGNGRIFRLKDIAALVSRRPRARRNDRTEKTGEWLKITGRTSSACDPSIIDL